MEKENDSLLVQLLSIPFLIVGGVVLLLWEFLKCFFRSEKCDLTDEELEQILEELESPKEQESENK